MYPEGISVEMDLSLDKFKIPGQELKNDAYRLRYSYVETYSQAALTVPGDKLVALSGMAKRFMTRTNDVYLTGMWRKRLEWALLWRSCPAESYLAVTRPSQYRAPSWSWAAMDGPFSHWIAVEYAHDMTKVHTSVQDLVLRHPTEDVTGVVLGGWLDLSAILEPMRLFYNDERWHMTAIESAAMQ